MSEILTIDTGANLPQQVEEEIEPLKLYDENFSMLREVMPEYKELLPNYEMTKLAKQLRMTMKKYGGIGISANQCGVRARVFVLGNDLYSVTCINPKIIDRSQELVKNDEGCLSYPGLFVKIYRPKWIDVEYTDESGEVKQERFGGMTARCFIHELEHMDGKVFVDHVGRLALKMAKQKQEKMIKNVRRKLKRKDGLFI